MGIEMLVANNGIKGAVRDAIRDFGNLNVKNVIFIQSPVLIEENGNETLLDILPFWMEYYGYYNLLNNPYKIIALGLERDSRELPYYINPCENGNTWDRFEQLVNTGTIDYSNFPARSPGKQGIEIFFSGHGEENVKGVVGKIADFVRNGVLMLQEGEYIRDVQEIFFNPAGEHLIKLKKRLERYRGIFVYLPWEKEINGLHRMIDSVGAFIKNPVDFKERFDEIINVVNEAVKGISELMKIHKISEGK